MTVHHAALFGCREPGYLATAEDGLDSLWHCPLAPGLQHATPKPGDLPRRPPCESLTSGTYFYAWVQRARQRFELPPGIGYRVGGDSGINYIVLQGHFFPEPSTPDHLGMRVTFAPAAANPDMKRASVFVSATEGIIPAKPVVHFEGACPLKEPIAIHPVAYRVHAHAAGYSISGWQVTPATKTWRLIGRRSPQLPEDYTRIDHLNLTLRQGDVIATRCVYHNTRMTEIIIG